MKTIVKILRGCGTDSELVSCIIAIIACYVFVGSLLWQIHWVMGLMSVYVTTDLIRISLWVVRKIEKTCKEERDF